MKNLLRILISFLFLFCLIQKSNAYSSGLLITEILPNPSGKDSEGEFLEIYNNSDQDINILEFQIDGKQINPYLNEIVQPIKPDSFIIIHDDNFDIKKKFPGNYSRAVLTSTSLANEGDTVILSDNEENIYDQFTYNDSHEDIVIVRPEIRCSTTTDSFDGNGSFLELEDPENYNSSIFKFQDCIIVQIFEDNRWRNLLETRNSSTIKIRLDYPENFFSINEFQWTIDNETNYYTNPFDFNSKPNSTHNLDLYLIYDENQTYSQNQIEVRNLDTIITEPTIRINEVFPNPSNSSEWLELYNFGDQKVDISGWKIEDSSFASPKPLPAIEINPDNYYVLEGTELKISLNNAGDEITILNKNDEIIDNYSYYKTNKDISLSYWKTKFFESTTATKATANIITEPSSGNNDKAEEEKENNQPNPVLGDIETIKSKPIGTFVETSGILTVNPNILGAKTFYIQDQTGGIKIKAQEDIINSDFKEGTEVKLLGVLENSVEEFYIEVDSQADLSILADSQDYYIKTPEENFAFEENEGQLVKLHGVLDSSSGDSFKIILGDRREMKVSILSNVKIDLPEKEKGDLIRITGILSQYKTSATVGEGYRLLPRKNEDIEIIQSVENMEDTKEEKDIAPKETVQNSKILGTNSSYSIPNYEDKADYKIARRYYELVPEIETQTEDNSKEEGRGNSDILKYSGMLMLSFVGFLKTPGSKELATGFAIYIKEFFQKSI